MLRKVIIMEYKEIECKIVKGILHVNEGKKGGGVER